MYWDLEGGLLLEVKNPLDYVLTFDDFRIYLSEAELTGLAVFCNNSIKTAVCLGNVLKPVGGDPTDYPDDLVFHRDIDEDIEIFDPGDAGTLYLQESQGHNNISNFLKVYEILQKSCQ